MDVSIFKGSWVTWDIDRGGSMRGGPFKKNIYYEMFSDPRNKYEPIIL